MTNIIFQFFILLLTIKAGEASGRLKLKMKTFNNPQHKLHDGSTCDGFSSNHCDNYFKICATSPSGTRCALGRSDTGELGGDSIVFGSRFGSHPNPLVYTFTTWAGSFTLSIVVWDEDGGILTKEDDLTARFDENIVAAAGRDEVSASWKPLSLRDTYSWMDIEVRVFCDTGYLVPACAEYCAFTNSSRGHYRCDFVKGEKVCLDGWYGDGCLKKRKFCRPHNDASGHYKCNPVTGDKECLAGWTNVSASCLQEIDECQSSPCLNDGTCTNLINDFNCSCNPGYTGRRCENDINECASNPCKFGRCQQPTVNNYTCQCYAGYEGQHCETDIDECGSNPCRNGNCINLVNNYQCICKAGYSGRSCEHEIKECESSPCKNNGTCIDLVASYKCKCMAGFKGRNCQTLSDKGGHVSSAGINPSPAKRGPKDSTLATSFMSKMSLVKRQFPSAKILHSSAVKIDVVDTSRKPMTLNRYDTTIQPRRSLFLGSIPVHQSSISKSQNTAGSVTEGFTTSLPAYVSKASGSESQAGSSMTASLKYTTTRLIEQGSDSSLSASLTEKLDTRKTKSATVTGAVTATSSASLDLRRNYSIHVQPRPSENSISVTSSISSGRQPQKGEEIQYRIEIKGDIAKWTIENQEIFKKEVCKKVIKSCVHDGGCAKSDPQFPKISTINENETKTSFFVSMEFALDYTTLEDKRDAMQCIQKSLYESSEQIQKLLPFAIKSVRLVSTVMSSANAAKTSHKSSSIVVVSEQKKKAGFGSDKSKMIAMLIAGHFFVIAGLSFAVHRLKKRSALKRIDQSPMIVHDEPFIREPSCELRQRSGSGDARKIKIRSNNNCQLNEFARKEAQLKRPLKLQKLNKDTLVDYDENYIETLYI